MNESQIAIIKEYDINKPNIHKIDKLTDKIITDCH